MDAQQLQALGKVLKEESVTNIANVKTFLDDLRKQVSSGKKITVTVQSKNGSLHYDFTS